MPTKIQIRRDTSVNWVTNNPILSSGELGYETDTYLLKIGDGISHWTGLSYIVTDSQGSGGAVYYLNANTQSSIPNYYDLNLIPNIGATIISVTSSTGTSSLISFITPANDPNVELLTFGNWHLNLYSALNTTSSGISIFSKIYKYNQSGTYSLLIETDETPISGTSINKYTTSGLLPLSTTISNTDRILIEILSKNNGSTNILHLHFDDISTPTHLLTTVIKTSGGNGTQGPQGEQGATGPQGIQGSNGIIGLNGVTGPRDL